MTDREEHKDRHKVLADVLERFGGDPSRWPQDVRMALGAWVTTDDAAAAAVREAAALDQVLASADTPGAEQLSALSARILSEIDNEDSGDASDAFDGRSGYKHMPVVPRQPIGGWSAPALLAASLIIGVWAGGVGLFDSVADSVQSAAASSTTDTVFIALSDDDGDYLVDEDLL